MSNYRKNPSENWQLILFEEVDGICPLCNKSLMYNKGKNSYFYKNCEAAHIYPLNPSEEELKLLKDVEKISDDPNDIENFIYLCTECHTKFDKPRTLEEYQELLDIKKKLLKKSDVKKIWHISQLQTEVSEIINALSVSEFNEQDVKLNYTPVEVVRKFDKNLSSKTKNKITNNIKDYFYEVREMLAQFDKLYPDLSNIIGAQIKVFYLQLKSKNHSQQDIFRNMVDWVDAKTKYASKDSCEAFISFFIQNCEVYDDNAK